MRLDLDNDEQQPIRHSFCRTLRRDPHWKCLILSFLIFGCLAAIAWCRLSVVTRMVVNYYERPYPRLNQSSPCADGYVYIPVAFVVMLYFVYLVECWHSHTRIQLQYKKVDINTVYDWVNSLREAMPIVWWKAVCYHYVRRSRQVTRYRNGDAFTTTQVYYERVNSYSASSALNYTTCGVKDISMSLSNLEKWPTTKIRFTKGFSFANVDAENEFEEQRSAFFQDHERRDDYMDTREGLDFMNTNFKDYMVAFADTDHLPWYVSHPVFWIASVFLCSWPLRVLIEYKTAYVHFHVHKLFGSNYVDSSQQHANLSRANTMESSDLESNILNNYTMVPSYSEALLMCNDSQSIHDANGNSTPYTTNQTSAPPSSTTSHSSNQQAQNATSHPTNQQFSSQSTASTTSLPRSNSCHTQPLSPGNSSAPSRRVDASNSSSSGTTLLAGGDSSRSYGAICHSPQCPLRVQPGGMRCVLRTVLPGRDASDRRTNQRLLFKNHKRSEVRDQDNRSWSRSSPNYSISSSVNNISDSEYEDRRMFVRQASTPSVSSDTSSFTGSSRRPTLPSSTVLPPSVSNLVRSGVGSSVSSLPVTETTSLADSEEEPPPSYEDALHMQIVSEPSEMSPTHRQRAGDHLNCMETSL